jgi:nucleoside-diphosphate-sugar epimerase
MNHLGLTKQGEEIMSNGNVTVLGSNGHVGNATMRGFRDAGWNVVGFGRSNRRPVQGTTFMSGDANELAAVKAAIAGADVVVYALHLPYDKWGNGASERQLQVVIDAMAGTGKTLMFPGTIYNYRASDRFVAPTLRQEAEAPRGAIRIRLEGMLRAEAEKGSFRVIILRAGDFYGPGETGDWFDQAMLMDYPKGKIHHLGDLDKGHSWAYLPDLGRAFAHLAGQRSTLAPFENFHFHGHWATHREMMAAIGKALPKPVSVSPMPWWLLRMVGLVNPIMRDIYRMRYLWLNEMELVDPRLDAMLGAGFGTPLDEAVGQTVASHLAAPRKAAA